MFLLRKIESSFFEDHMISRFISETICEFKCVFLLLSCRVSEYFVVVVVKTEIEFEIAVEITFVVPTLV